jgi:hypothetical protein
MSKILMILLTSYGGRNSSELHNPETFLRDAINPNGIIPALLVISINHQPSNWSPFW